MQVGCGLGTEQVLNNNDEVIHPLRDSGRLSTPSSPRAQRALLPLPANTSPSLRESRLRHHFPSYPEPGFLCVPAPSALQWEPRGVAGKGDESRRLLPSPAVQTPRGMKRVLRCPRTRQ